MPWENDYLELPSVLSVRVWGEVTLSTWREQLKESIEQARAHCCSGYLVDYRESDIKMSFVELFNRPRIYEELGMPHRARIALVFKDDYPETDFIELVTENRGYRVKTFRSPELAVSWLTNKPHESLLESRCWRGTGGFHR